MSITPGSTVKKGADREPNGRAQGHAEGYPRIPDARSYDIARFKPHADTES